MIKIIFLIFSLMTLSSLHAKDRAVSEDHKEKYCPKDDNWHFHCDPEEEMRKEEKRQIINLLKINLIKQSQS